MSGAASFSDRWVRNRKVLALELTAAKLPARWPAGERIAAAKRLAAWLTDRKSNPGAEAALALALDLAAPAELADGVLTLAEAIATGDADGQAVRLALEAMRHPCGLDEVLALADDVAAWLDPPGPDPVSGV